MTEEQQKALITELIGIREGMATKADLLKLETGIGDNLIRTHSLIEDIERYIISVGGLAALSDTRGPNRKDAANPEESAYRKELNRLTERVDRLSNWYHQTQQDFLERIEKLERPTGSAAR